jgi:parallel beta-helix repeat protein
MNARSWRRGWWLASLPAVAAALLVAPAGAADGLSCGSTITVDTTLTHNLHCAAGGLVVASDGVTLDLAGHTLVGHGAGAGITVAAAGVTVTNGAVTQFEQGVIVGSAANQATLTRLTVKKNGTGLLIGPGLTAPMRGTVADSVFTNNDLNGIDIDGGTFWTIEDATIAHNGGNGINAHADSFRQTIVRDRINDNVGHGVDLQSQNDGSTIADNVASRNGGDGIHVDSSTTHITGNTTHANQGSGIWVNEDAGLSFGPAYLIAGNSSTGNLGFGIRSCIFVDNAHTCEPGMIDGGGNVARANQQLPECINVVCVRRQ